MDFDTAYDLDGVLAEKPPLPDKPWGRMKGDERKARRAFLLEHYRTARRLLIPEGKFIVLSARKGTEDVKAVTYKWFEQNFGFVPTIFFLEKSRSLKNVIAFKSEVIERFNIKTHYEDNRQVLKGLKLAHPECSYLYVSPSLTITPF